MFLNTEIRKTYGSEEGGKWFICELKTTFQISSSFTEFSDLLKLWSTNWWPLSTASAYFSSLLAPLQSSYVLLMYQIIPSSECHCHPFFSKWMKKVFISLYVYEPLVSQVIYKPKVMLHSLT